MSNELLSILEYIEQERGINRESLVKALENALLTASRKSIHPASRLRVEVNPKTGTIQAWATLEVVENMPNNDQLLLAKAKERFPDVQVGDEVEWEVTPRNFGRIAAQTAKQAIMQQLRKAEKEIVRDVFADRIGQIINGVVRRFDSGDVIIDFQNGSGPKAEGILTSREKISGEQYSTGDRINALLLRVDILSPGPSLIVSRSQPEFVRRLFEREVAEIHDGTVEIVAVAREAGSRTKIAVRSNDNRVDPVGACVGLRGNRVRNITSELNGERIDIVNYDEDIAKFAANALQPAQVEKVEVDEEKHELTVYVSAGQSKLAFGKKAQNVRLSSWLLGWSINIRTEGEEAGRGNSMEEKKKLAAGLLAGEINVSVNTAVALVDAGYLSADGLIAAGLEDVIKCAPQADPAEIKGFFASLDNNGDGEDMQ